MLKKQSKEKDEEIINFLRLYESKKGIRTQMFLNFPLCKNIYCMFTEVCKCPISLNSQKCYKWRNLKREIQNSYKPVYFSCNPQIIAWIIPIWENEEINRYIVCGPVEIISKDIKLKTINSENLNKKFSMEEINFEANYIFSIMNNEENIINNNNSIDQETNELVDINLAFKLEYSQITNIVGKFIHNETEQGKEALNQILADILLWSSDLEKIKYQVIELFVVLIRVSKFKKMDLKTLEDLFHGLLICDNYDDICCVILNLCNYYFDNINKYKIKLNNPVLEKILKYINENYKQDISLSTISKELHFNPSYISRLFKKNLGITLSKYIKEFRIKKAKILLLTTDLLISEISEKVGFTEPSHFSKNFKMLENCSPTKFRIINKKR